MLHIMTKIVQSVKLIFVLIVPYSSSRTSYETVGRGNYCEHAYFWSSNAFRFFSVNVLVKP